MEISNIRNNLKNWAMQFKLNYREVPDPVNDIHIILNEENLPNVDVIYKNSQDGILLFVGRISLDVNNINIILSLDSEEIINFVTKIQETFLIMNIEYVSKEGIKELPTAWELICKANINELSSQKFWDCYLKIKNAIFVVIINVKNIVQKKGIIKINNTKEI